MPADIRWEEMKSLHRACGIEVVENSRSRIGLSKGCERTVMHRQRSRPTIGRETVREIASFLEAVRLKP